MENLLDLGQAFVAAAKFARPGKVWGISDAGRRYVLGRRGVSELVLEADMPPGVVAVDADGCWAARGTLEDLGTSVSIAVSDSAVHFQSPRGAVVIPRLSADDVPMVRSLGAVTWVRIAWPTFEAILRVAATAAAEGREDRPGLATVKLGPESVEATDEVIVARAPSPLSFGVRVPAELLPLLPRAKESDVYIADLGGGGAAFATGDPASPRALLSVDGAALAGTWFPDLRAVWTHVDSSEVLLATTVPRAALSRAVKAATDGSLADVVQLEGADASLSVRGDTVIQAVPAPGSKQGQACVLVRGAALRGALAKGPKEVTLLLRGPGWPIEVCDEIPAGAVRTLVFPVARVGG